MSIYRHILVAILMIIATEAVFSQEKAAVDYRAAETRLVQVGDSSIVKLIGDVFLIHNGAIISCDSAYRYSEKRFEAYGKVIINQDSVYIYGDKVIYNGETDIAEVLSELVKVVDNDVVMYTREMFFNTKTRVGYFSKGATVKQQNSRLESLSGSYDSENKVITLTDDVAMENEEYILKGTALTYNQINQVAKFNTLTNIWNVKGEYLQADKGQYEQIGNIYHFEKNSYILTEEQECWADSLIYYSDINEVELKENIQINDTVQMASTFGDYGYFWNVSKRVLMTRDPAAFTYNQNSRDSLFVAADTIIVAPILEKGVKTDSLQTKDNSSTTELRDKVDEAVEKADVMTSEKLQEEIDRQKEEMADSLQDIDIDREEMLRREMLMDSLPPSVRRDSILKWNSLPTFIPLYNKEQLAEMNDKARRRAENRMKRYEKRFDRELVKYLRDAVYIEKLEREKEIADSLAAKPEQVVEEATEEVIEEVKNIADSSDMVITAYNNAKIYRADMQSIADTMVVETVDSTTTSIGSPIAWNIGNQITAGRIRSYVKDGAVNRTRMFDDPLMVQKVDEEMFNQMKGETMDALYRNNAIYRLIVTENAKARMYREEPDEATNILQIVAFITSSSKNMIIDMDSSYIERVKWVGETATSTYPMNEIPAEERELEGFKWVPELRPTRDSIFTREIRQSLRVEREAIRKPDFGITKRIMDDRTRLINSGVWIDRNDKLKVNREELIKQSLR